MAYREVVNGSLFVSGDNGAWSFRGRMNPVPIVDVHTIVTLHDHIDTHAERETPA